jgi:hypothetical protein
LLGRRARGSVRVARPGPDEIDPAFGFRANDLRERRCWAIKEDSVFSTMTVVQPSAVRPDVFPEHFLFDMVSNLRMIWLNEVQENYCYR